MELLFFDRPEDDGRPSRVIPIDPRRIGLITIGTCLYRVWQPGQIYGFGFMDRFEPAAAVIRFDPIRSSCSTRTAAPL